MSKNKKAGADVVNAAPAEENVTGVAENVTEVAENVTEVVENATEAAENVMNAVPAVSIPDEPTYTVKELTAARGIFGDGIPSFLVSVALKKAGVKEATIEQAREIVLAFANKEVRG